MRPFVSAAEHIPTKLYCIVYGVITAKIYARPPDVAKASLLCRVCTKLLKGPLPAHLACEDGMRSV